MITYVETAHRSTNVPVVSLSSYALGPMDSTQLTPFQAQLSEGEGCVLLVPTQISPSLLAHPAFRDGAEWGYLEGNPPEEDWTVSKLMNELYENLAELYEPDEIDLSPWILGFLLGELANIAEEDQTLALTGLAHYSFLFPLLVQECPSKRPLIGLYHAESLHRHALKAYRARVRLYREQGKSFAEAQRLALC